MAKKQQRLRDKSGRFLSKEREREIREQKSRAAKIGYEKKIIDTRGRFLDKKSRAQIIEAAQKSGIATNDPKKINSWIKQNEKEFDKFFYGWMQGEKKQYFSHISNTLKDPNGNDIRRVYGMDGKVIPNKDVLLKFSRLYNLAASELGIKNLQITMKYNRHGELMMPDLDKYISELEQMIEDEADESELAEYFDYMMEDMADDGFSFSYIKSDPKKNETPA